MILTLCGAGGTHGSIKRNAHVCNAFWAPVKCYGKYSSLRAEEKLAHNYTNTLFFFSNYV